MKMPSAPMFARTDPARRGPRPSLRVVPAALLMVAATACSSPAPAVPPSPAPASLASTPGSPPAASSAAAPAALPAGPCGDDQPGRYGSELFTPQPVHTVPFSADLLADIYSPAGDPATCRAGVVWVHGGGFTQGTRNGDAEHAWGNAMAARGYVLASIDYRLGTGAPFSLDQATDTQSQAIVTAAVSDGQTAVNWLRGAGTAYGVDPQRVAIGGTSAGAMSALGVGLTAPEQDRACAVVSVSGDLDPAWIGTRPPPVLFIHGNADDVVPYDSSVTGVDLLTAAGGTATLVTIDGAGHEITGVPTPDMVQAAAGWFRAHAAATCG